jgi:anti-sigma regulatory factor (Ser/Thr protein kinase)
VDRSELVASEAYQPEPSAAAAARRFVRTTLEEWFAGAPADGGDLVDDAVLLTSELVTNAVVHARTRVQVVCRLIVDVVEVVVTDADPAGLVPEPRREDPDPGERTSGRGLLLPAALSLAWGVTYGQAVKAVWFRLGLAGRAVGGTGTGGRQNPAEGGRADAAPTDGETLAAVLQLVPPTGDVAPVFPSAVTADGDQAGAGMRLPGTALPAGGMAINGSGETPHGHLDRVSEPGFDAMLTLVLDSARSSVGADTAYVLLADEDGDLRLRAAVGSLPGPQAAGGSANGAVPAIVTVAFVVDGRVTGLLTAASAAGSRFAEEDAARLQRVADRWGAPLERARLADLERIRRARRGALAEARALLIPRVGRGEAMAVAARAAVPRLAPWCAVLLVRGRRLRTAFACHADDSRSPALSWLLDRHGGSAAGAAAMGIRTAVPGQAGPGQAGKAWRWPLDSCDLRDAPAQARELAADDAWCFPMGAGRTSGLFVIGHQRHERLPREVADLAADLACRVGLALRTPAARDGRDPAGVG